MNAALKDRARHAFARQFGQEPDGLAFAPGRVNLIGDHVDYNDGLVLPLVLPLGTSVAWGRNNLGTMRAVAADFNDESDSFIPGRKSTATPGWKAYLRGMSAVLQSACGDAPQLDLAIAGDLPRGAGLSSSASLCVALGRALQASGAAVQTTPVELAQAAQRTEHEFAHVACGIMDQMAAACGQAGHAMLLDCRSLEMQHLPIPDGWAVLVVQSGVTRGLVDGAYNLRRKQCNDAARRLGLASLREARLSDLAAAALPEIEARRAQHVIEEIARVESATNCLANDDLAGFGRLLNASHASLRDLFEVSHPQVDRLVDILQRAVGNNGGARMTGGGFGGAVVAVAPGGEVQRLKNTIADEYSSSAAETIQLACGCGRHASGKTQCTLQDQHQ